MISNMVVAIIIGGCTCMGLGFFLGLVYAARRERLGYKIGER